MDLGYAPTYITAAIERQLAYLYLLIMLTPYFRRDDYDSSLIQYETALFEACCVAAAAVALLLYDTGEASTHIYLERLTHCHEMLVLNFSKEVGYSFAKVLVCG